MCRLQGWCISSLRTYPCTIASLLPNTQQVLFCLLRQAAEQFTHLSLESLLCLNYDSFPPIQAILLALLPVPSVATSGSQSALHSSGHRDLEAGVKCEIHPYPPSSLVTSSNASSFLEIKNSHKVSPCCSWPSGMACTQDT